MVLMDRNKRNCSEPHRVHGSLVFRDGEPKDNEKRCFFFFLLLLNKEYAQSEFKNLLFLLFRN